VTAETDKDETLEVASPQSISVSPSRMQIASKEAQWRQRRRIQLEFRRDELLHKLNTLLKTFDDELLKVRLLLSLLEGILFLNHSKNTVVAASKTNISSCLFARSYALNAMWSIASSLLSIIKYCASKN
jgi:hypothetical protein